MLSKFKKKIQRKELKNIRITVHCCRIRWFKINRLKND